MVKAAILFDTSYAKVFADFVGQDIADFIVPWNGRTNILHRIMPP